MQRGQPPRRWPALGGGGPPALPPISGHAPPPSPAPSSLTQEQADCAERNRLEALRRQAERQAERQAGAASGPAPTTHATPSSRPSLRGVFMQGPAARTPQPPAAYQPPAAQRTPQHPPPQHPQQQQAHPAPQPWPPLSSQPPAAQQPHPGYAQPAFTAGSTPGSSGAAPPTIRALFGGPTLSTAAPVSASTPAAPAMHQLQRPAPLPPLFQQSQRFSFQPPPGLVPSSDEEVAQQELAPQAPLYQATPPQGWAPANPAAPTVQAVPASTAFGGGGQRAPAPPAAAPRPAPRAGAGGKAGSGKRGGKPGTGSSNIVWSFDPTPQPVKPTVQVTLQEAVSRHAKAAAEKRQQPQQQHQPEAGAEQAAQAHQPAPSQARSLGLPPLPPALQGAGRATPAKPAAEPWLPTQPVFAAPSPFQPAGPAQHEATAPAAPLLSAGVQAPRRPPLPRGRFKEPAEGARGSAWAPAASAAGASSTRGQPASAEACRARLQHLLCADADPFAAAAASTGRRWEWLREPRDSAGRPPSHPDHDPTTLLIPASAWGADLKGADAQYWRIKADGCAHTVMFFQEGNFYHLKDRDADIGMRVGLHSMGGARGSAANMWTVGCNVSAFSEWAAKVLAVGYAVARVDEDKRGQREPGSSLVRRALRQVYSPGTLLDGLMLDACGGAQPLVTLWEGRDLRFGACVVDVQSATLTLASWQEADPQRSMLRALLLTADPAEVGFGRGQLAPEVRRLLRGLGPVGGGGGRSVMLTHIGYTGLPADPDSEDPADLEALLEHTADMFHAQRGKPGAFAAARPKLTPHAAAALQLAIHQLVLTQAAQAVLPPATLAHMEGLDGVHASGHMLLDACALRSLELLTNSEGGRPGSLLHLLDGVATPAGRRKLRQFVSCPLYRVGDIEERLDCTELLMAHPEAAYAFQDGLHRAPDCERLLAKAANTLAGVVEKVEAAEEADEAVAQQAQQTQQGWSASGTSSVASGSRWAPPPLQRQQPAATAASRWASPNPRPPSVAQQRAAEASRVEQLASVLDLSQAAFLPAVQLFEGTGMMIEALHGLHTALLAGRGASGPGGAAVLPPPVQRAVQRGEAVAEALQLLAQVFDAERFNDGAADIALEPGLSPEYDTARARLDQLQAQAGAALEGIRGGLRERGAAAAALKRVKLVDYRGEQLLQVPTALRHDLEALTPGVACMKEAQTIAKYRLPGVAATLQAIEEARDAAKLCVLRFLAQSARLFLDSYGAFRRLFCALSTLDVLAGFAAATRPEAAPPGCTFCRPTFAAAAAPEAPAPPLHLEGLWNPALLASQAAQCGIQPNDLHLGGPCGAGAAGQPGMLLLTGANSGGKSTLLRAACLAAVMAQIGCFVPCAAAELAPVDRIFTRVGAQDRIFSGQSTFAVEMLETASALHHSTPASLVVLDELGRGTATHDGQAIAYGVALWLAQAKRCRCLFATHHHSLCQDPALAPLVQLGHMEAAVAPERGLLPSYRLAPGPAPMGSCGIEVAATCELPAAVIARAAQVAQRAEEAGQPGSSAGSGGSTDREPLHERNSGSGGGHQPAAKRQRLQPAAPHEAALAAEQGEALAAVRATLAAALQGAPGAAEHLARLQAAVRSALAAGQL